MSLRIDTLVAEHVMKFQFVNPVRNIDKDHQLYLDGEGFRQWVPNYSTELKHAWKVLNKDGGYAEINTAPEQSTVTLGGSYATADTLAMAICLAALQDRKVKIEK